MSTTPRFQTLAIAMSCMLASCTGIRANDSNGAAYIYYENQSQADADLEQFDKDNPSCQFWTNWQKMCSRTGVDGGTYCVPAADHSVEASLPFCMAHENSPPSAPSSKFDGINAVESFLRFCDNRDHLDKNDPEIISKCQWSASRPFNGNRPSELKHPWCNKWRQIPSLGPAKQLWCSYRNVPSWCVWPEGLGNGPQDNHTHSPDLIAIGSPNPASRPINGVFCRRKVDNAG